MASLLASAKVANSSDAATTSSINTTGASLLVVHVSVYSVTGTIADSVGNTWTKLTSYGSDAKSTLYYCVAPTTSTTHTVTHTGIGSYRALEFMAFDGVGTLVSATGTSVSPSTTIQPGSLTPAIADLLVTGCNGMDSVTDTVSSPYTVAQQTTWVPGTMASACAYYYATATTARNPTWTGGSNYRAASHARFAGLLPLLTAAPVLASDLSHTAATYYGQNNGTVTISYFPQHYVAGEWDDDPDSFMAPVNGRNYRLICRGTNNSGYDAAQDGISNTITYSGGGVTGTGSMTLPKPTITATGSPTVSGSGTVSLNPPNVAGVGAGTITGSGAVTLATPILVGAGSPVVSGSGAVTLSPPTIAASGSSEPTTITGVGSIAIAPPSVIASGSSAITGVGAMSHTPTVTGIGVTAVTGIAVIMLAPPSVYGYDSPAINTRRHYLALHPIQPSH